MNDYFQDNKRSLLILVGLLFILSIVLYIIVLRPLLADLSSKEKAIVSIEDDIELLEAKLEKLIDDGVDLDIDQLTLEKKIPQARELDEYILSLQKLETVTASKVEKIEFVYDSSLETIEEETVEEEPVDDIDDDIGDSEEEEENDEAEELETVEAPTIDPEILNEKPESLQVMTVRLTAISPTYEEFIELLQAIENEDRISIVSNLHFTQPTETDTYFGEDPVKTIPFEAELTTFYYEE